MDPETNQIERVPLWKSPVGAVLVAFLILILIGVIAGIIWLAGTKASDRPVSRTDPMWMEFHDSINRYIKGREFDLLFVGSTITLGMAEDESLEVWQSFYGERRAFNIGAPGDQTQNILWRFEHGNLDGYQPKTIVVMTGTENILVGQPTEKVVRGIEAVVDALHNRFPDADILLMAVFPVGRSANHPHRQVMSETNERLQEYAESSPHVEFFNINSEFLLEDGTVNTKRMKDQMHLSREGYQVWAGAIEKAITESLNRHKRSNPDQPTP